MLRKSYICIHFYINLLKIVFLFIACLHIIYLYNIEYLSLFFKITKSEYITFKRKP